MFFVDDGFWVCRETCKFVFVWGSDLANGSSFIEVYLNYVATESF